MSTPSNPVSVIIPALNEAEALPALLSDLADQSALREVIVVDGGSTDHTRALATAAGARVLRSRPGRGTQLALGASRAHGSVLLFLHADSRLAPDAVAQVARRLSAAPDCPGGNFDLRFDGGDGFSTWLNGFYRWLRARRCYYGDSGIFCRRDVFERIGGIRPIALMEDYDLVRRIEACGPSAWIQGARLLTSSRRFRGRPPPAIVWGWVRIHLMFWAGVNPTRLARIYRSERHGTAPSRHR